MPGQGGPPPPGAGGPGGGDLLGGGPEGILKLLASFQQQPPPSGEDQMLNEASTMINAAYARILQRSSKAAKLLAEANVKIQGAREALKAEPDRNMAPPPDLMGGMNPGASALPMGL